MKQVLLLLPLAMGCAWAAEVNPVRATSPVLVKSVEPQYSLEGRLVSAQGQASLDVLIDEAGRVADIRFAQPLGFGLDEQAAAAVKEWRFQPAMRDGAPVATRANIEVEFRLNEGTAKRWMVREFSLNGPAGFAAPVVNQGQIPANTTDSRSSGEVSLKFRINESGAVEAVETFATTETAPETERLRKEVSAWRFTPAQVEGKPVGVDAVLTIYRGTPRRAATAESAVASLR